MADDEGHGQAAADAASTANVLTLFHDAAKASPGALEELAEDLKDHGDAAPAPASTHAQEIMAMMTDYQIADAELRKVGASLCQPDALLHLAAMDVETCMKSVPAGADPIRVLIAYVDTAVAGDRVRALQQPDKYDDADERAMRAPVRDRSAVRVAALLSGVFCTAYLILRVVDIALLQEDEGSGLNTFYRLVILFVELLYGASGVMGIVARSRRPIPLDDIAEDDQRLFTPSALLTLLFVSDEDEKTLTASITSHYEASKSLQVPFKVLLLAEMKTPAVDAVLEALKSQFPTLDCFSYDHLAAQDYVRGTGPEANTVQNIVLANKMGHGQAIYYALDRLHYQHTFPVSRACVAVMDGSSVVDGAKYYDYATSNLQRFGVAVVNTPTYVRNHTVVGDFLDVNGIEREKVYVAGALAEHKCAVFDKAFMARGYSLYRMLRRMELENVDTDTLDWMMYYMAVETQQASVAVYDDAAPTTSRLAHTNTTTLLQSKIMAMVESFDVFGIFFREHSFTSWNMFSPLGAPHFAARTATAMEATILTVVLVAVFGGVMPWSTTSLYVAASFLLHYLWLMFAQVFTAYGMRLGMWSSAMQYRVLATASSLIYFFNLSRFTVDRRGHFRTAGETTTADLVALEKDRRVTRAPEYVAKMKADEKAKAIAAKEKAAVAKVQKKADEKELKVKKKQEKKGGGIPMAMADSPDSKSTGDSSGGRVGTQPLAEGLAQGDASTPSLWGADLSGGLESIVVSGRGSGEAVAEGLFGKKKDAPAAGSPVEVGEAPASPGVPARERLPRRAPAPTGRTWYGAKRAPVVAVPVDDAVALDAAVAPAKPGRFAFLKKAPATNRKPTARAPDPWQKPQFKKVKKAKRVYDNAAPAVPGGGGRTGKGSMMRPHMTIMRTSFVLAVLLILAALASIFFAYVDLLGSGAPANYTLTEVLSARAWLLCSVLLSIFIILPALVYVSVAAHVPGVTTNRVSGVVILVLSVLTVLATGVIPLLAVQNLKTRDTLYSLDQVAAANTKFFAAMQTGPDPGAVNPAATNALPPWRGPSQLSVSNTATGASLAGGWVTGPGNSKFTYPQALAVLDLSLAVTASYDDLVALGTLESVHDSIVHGLTHLFACHNEGTNALISHVAAGLPGVGADWTRPEASNPTVPPVLQPNVGVETYCTVAAAFAAASRALTYTTNEAYKALGVEAARRAKTLYTASQAVNLSYATQFSAESAFWPSNPALLNDDKLLAAAVMLFAFSENLYRNHVEAYYTFSQRERHAQGLLHSYAMGPDDHWWTANLVLTLADPLNTRYADAMERFTDAWTQNGNIVDDTGIIDKGGLSLAANDYWAAAAADGSNAFTTSGPLGSNMRAMAYITLHAAAAPEETSVERASVCFAKGQLRHVLGSNDQQRSYVVGLGIDGAAAPARASDRAASCPPDPNSGCGPSFFSSGAANPSVLLGAVVQGPGARSAFQDVRTSPQYTGVSILNNSPLTVLTASLHGRDLNIQDCIGLNPKASLGRTNAASVALPSF